MVDKHYMADFGTLLSKIADVVMGNGDTGRARVGVLLDGTAGQAPVTKQVELGSPAHNAGCYRATDYYPCPLPTCRLELSSFGGFMPSNVPECSSKCSAMLHLLVVR